MSTLKTHNLQSPDAGSVNIALTPNAGMVVAGVSTYSNSINVGSNIKLGSAGIVTASNFKTGVSNLHDVGLTLSGGQLDIGSNIKAGNAGVITATAFHGSGANLTGLASREFYGFVGVGSHLQLVYTNNGADNISSTSYASLEENFFGPSGITFTINSDGRLIANV